MITLAGNAACTKKLFILYFSDKTQMDFFLMVLKGTRNPVFIIVDWQIDYFDSGSFPVLSAWVLKSIVLYHTELESFVGLFFVGGMDLRLALEESYKFST